MTERSLSSISKTPDMEPPGPEYETVEPRMDSVFEAQGLAEKQSRILSRHALGKPDKQPQGEAIPHQCWLASPVALGTRLGGKP